jgi:hypothetical protein
VTAPETRAEWGVLNRRDNSVCRYATEANARRIAHTTPTSFGATVVHRTVTAGPWNIDDEETPA